MKQALSEQKTQPCEICSTVFSKQRYDQKFCSKPCREEAKKFYHRTKWIDRTDRTEQNAARKARYYVNRPHILERQKQWRLANPDEAKKKDHETYLKYKEKYVARMQAYRKAHPLLRQKEYRTARAKRPWNAVLQNAQSRALKKKLAFNLTREWAERNWTGRCALTNLPFSFGNRHHYPFAPSMDRIDSGLGYTTDNCRFVLFAVNSFKGVGTDAEMLTIAKALVSELERVP